MFSSVLSADVRGIFGVPILVETDISDGLPGLTMVGYLTSAVKESADRVRTAMKNTGISLPPKKITINLSPADTKKEGTGFDLAIAISMMCSLGMFPPESIEEMMFLGELGLLGKTAKSTTLAEEPSTIEAILSGITWAIAFAKISASLGSVLVTVTRKTSVPSTDAADIIPFN